MSRPRSIAVVWYRARAFIAPFTVRKSSPAHAGKHAGKSDGSVRQSTSVASETGEIASTTFAQRVTQRLGTPSHFFCAVTEAPGIAEQLWGYAQTAYLDSALPSLFKERLFVHLSRFCAVRYCIVRHFGFLIGHGYPAGDATATPDTLEQAIELIGRTVPNAPELEAVFARLETHAETKHMPAPRTLAERDLFDALAIIFVVPGNSTQARAAVRHAVGKDHFEELLAFLGFIRTAHYWTETHPDLSFETDMIMLMAQHKHLGRLLLDTMEAERIHAGDALREALTGQLHVLNTELQHRTRNLLGVVQATFDRTLAKHSTLEGFAAAFSTRLEALGRVQGYLSQLVDGRKVTFDSLLRTELAAHAGAPDQITLDGPAGIRLRSSTVQTFALTIHELVVNAEKYGALSSPTARLAVQWQLETIDDGKSPLLHVQWHESGVDVSHTHIGGSEPGYGRELVERALPYQLRANTHYEVTPDGMRCSISVPVLAG